MFTKEVTFEAIKKLMENSISLNKLSKLYNRLNTVLKLSQTKNIYQELKANTNEVKRINKIVPLVQTLNDSSTKAVVYLSKYEDEDPNSKVLLSNNQI